MSKITVKSAIGCGFMTRKTWDRAKELPEKTVRMIAAMALSAIESKWSDAYRDLARGVECAELGKWGYEVFAREKTKEKKTT